MHSTVIYTGMLAPLKPCETVTKGVPMYTTRFCGLWAIHSFRICLVYIHMLWNVRRTSHGCGLELADHSIRRELAGKTDMKYIHYIR